MIVKTLRISFISVFYSIASGYAAEGRIDDEAALGRTIPTYFKICTFDVARWQEFTDAFPTNVFAQNIKANLTSVQLSSLSFAEDTIFASEFFKQKMREEYNCSFKGERSPAPCLQVVDSKGMFDGIVEILQTTEGDVDGFKNRVGKLITDFQRIVLAYNTRLEKSGGNSALLKHFLSKIFFASAAYTDVELISMRRYLKERGLVDGDPYLFADAKDPSHRLIGSLAKYLELEGMTDTLVLGCGRSLIADVEGVLPYCAEDFLKPVTKKTFVHSCQHCLDEHDRALCVALYEDGTTEYDGWAHADIAADALVPGFWDALGDLQRTGRNPIKRIVDHSYIIDGLNPRIHNVLGVGGLFTTYINYTGKIEEHGFELQRTQTRGVRMEYVYVKVR